MMRPSLSIPASSGDPAVVAALQAADAALGGRITVLEEAPGGGGDHSAEIIALQNADTALSGRITALEEVPAPDDYSSAISGLNTRVTSLEQSPGGGSSVFIDVRAHGAAGNGSTDDTVAIQAAFDAASAAIASGAAASASVYVPAGLYLVDPVFVTSSNVTIFGDGLGASILKRKAATVTNTDSLGVLNFHGNVGNRLSRVTVRDLGADGNRANIVIGSGGDALDVECFSFVYVDHAHVERCLGQNSTSEAFDLDYCADGNIVDCVSSDCLGNGIHFSLSSVRMRGRGCRSFNCGTAANSRGGFDVHFSATDCGYTDCHAKDCYRGFILLGHHNELVGCTVIGSANTGIRLEGNDNSVVGCRSKGTIAGNGLTIVGVRNTVTGGVYVGNSGHGITGLSGTSNNIVSGVVCQGNGARGLLWNTGTIKNTSVGCQLGGNTDVYLDGGTGNIATGNVLN